jgi:hypothetical protein
MVAKLLLAHIPYDRPQWSQGRSFPGRLPRAFDPSQLRQLNWNNSPYRDSEVHVIGSQEWLRRLLKDRDLKWWTSAHDSVDLTSWDYFCALIMKQFELMHAMKKTRDHFATSDPKPFKGGLYLGFHSNHTHDSWTYSRPGTATGVFDEWRQTSKKKSESEIPRPLKKQLSLLNDMTRPWHWKARQRHSREIRATYRDT